MAMFRRLAFLLLAFSSSLPALTPEEVERLHEAVEITAGRLHLETDTMYYRCWLMDCVQYRGEKGAQVLAKAHAEVRQEFVNWAKHEISYWKEVPDAVAAFKEAFAIGLEYLDMPPPFSRADMLAWEDRQRDLLEKFESQMAKAQAALELAEK